MADSDGSGGWKWSVADLGIASPVLMQRLLENEAVLSDPHSSEDKVTLSAERDAIALELDRRKPT